MENFILLSELKDLATEAAQSDGRLARRPLNNRNKEIEAHCLLLSEITHMIHEYDASIRVDNPSTFHFEKTME